MGSAFLFVHFVHLFQYKCVHYLQFVAIGDQYVSRVHKLGRSGHRPTRAAAAGTATTATTRVTVAHGLRAAIVAASVGVGAGGELFGRKFLPIFAALSVLRSRRSRRVRYT